MSAFCINVKIRNITDLKIYLLELFIYIYIYKYIKETLVAASDGKINNFEIFFIKKKINDSELY